MDIKLLLKIVSCKMCCKVPKCSIVFQCSRSHNICITCYDGSNLTKCWLCGGSYLLDDDHNLQRNKAIEAIADIWEEHECMYEEFGCSFKANLASVESHEKSCSFSFIPSSTSMTKVQEPNAEKTSKNEYDITNTKGRKSSTIDHNIDLNKAEEVNSGYFEKGNKFENNIQTSSTKISENSDSKDEKHESREENYKEDFSKPHLSFEIDENPLQTSNDLNEFHENSNCDEDSVEEQMSFEDFDNTDGNSSDMEALNDSLTIFECDICRKKFSRNRHLVRHQNNFHSKKTCPGCGKIFYNAEKIRRHKYICKRKILCHFSCEQCDKKYGTAGALRSHQVNCTKCRKQFCGKIVFKKHKCSGEK